MRSSVVAALFTAALAMSLAACAPPPGGDAGTSDDDAGADAGPPNTGYDLPIDSLVPTIGTAGAIDIAAWNVENFPQSETTPAVMADLITSMGLDLIAVEEITSETSFTELVSRLPYHRGVLSGHTYSDGTYQKVGYIYRDDLLEISDVTQIFAGAGYEFPRPPLQARFTVIGTDVDFTAIAIHLKAGTFAEDRARRTDAMVSLFDYIKSMIDGPADDDVILLGDFNEVLTTGVGQSAFGALLTDPDFRVQTANVAAAGGVTFLPTSVILDHIVTTVSLDDELQGGGLVIPPLDSQLVTYRGNVSDHLPVVISMPVLQ